jgi:hypothetical protein
LGFEVAGSTTCNTWGDEGGIGIASSCLLAMTFPLVGVITVPEPMILGLKKNKI